MRGENIVAVVAAAGRHLKGLIRVRVSVSVRVQVRVRVRVRARLG